MMPMIPMTDNPNKQRILVHRIVPHSTVNGPGRRAVVWTQGCSIGCPGCFNPETHTLEQAVAVWHDPVELGRDLARLSADGLTVSGGEPLDQPIAVTALINAYRSSSSGTVLLFTGYAIESIMADPDRRLAIASCDAVLAGPYVPGKAGALWSAKQLLNITGEIPPKDMIPRNMFEISILGNEEVVLSGYPDRRHQTTLSRLL